MDAKEYLETYRKALVDIDRSNIMIDRLSAALEARGIDTTKERIKTSNLDDHMASLVIELIEAKEKLHDAFIYAARQAAEVSAVIGAVSDSVQRELLTLRYLDGKRWHEVSAAIHYGQTRTHAIHHSALAEVEKILSGLKE